MSGSPRTIHVGGQYGAGTDLREQVRNALRSALRSVEAVVVSAGGTLDEVVAGQVALLHGQDVADGRGHADRDAGRPRQGTTAPRAGR